MLVISINAMSQAEGFHLCLSVCICGLMSGAVDEAGGGEARKLASCRVQLGAYIMIHVLIAWGSRVSLAMLARLGAGKVGTLGAWSEGPQGVSSTLPSFKRPEWILEPRARI